MLKVKLGARNITLWNIWAYRRLDRYVADSYMKYVFKIDNLAYF